MVKGKLKPISEQKAEDILGYAACMSELTGKYNADGVDAHMSALRDVARQSGYRIVESLKLFD